MRVEMARFEIHSQLLADCHPLGCFQLCHVLLHKNSLVPWFILVPENPVMDLLDLSQELSSAAMSEAARVSHFIKTVLGWPKVNFAAIGNLVPQLHLHVVGRRPDDPCWPAPVWGNLTASREYSLTDLARMIAQLTERCGLKQINAGSAT
jgi:Diadenosine tetraphosphate (Ap4A) hydrolase and other HIT family hydrolases